MPLTPKRPELVNSWQGPAAVVYADVISPPCTSTASLILLAHITNHGPERCMYLIALPDSDY